MEHFFKPTPRLPIEPYHDYAEVQLAVSMETFLNHSWDWSDLKAFFTGNVGEMWKVLWITEGTFIWFEDENTAVDFNLLEDYAIQRATITASNDERYDLVLAKNMDSASLSAGVSSIFWHAVTTSNCVKLRLRHWFSCFELCPGPALLQFLGASLFLELLEFKDFEFKEAHCRALASLERKDLEVTFKACSFDAQGAEDTFVEWLRHSQVVTKLKFCKMESSIISALSGNSSVKSFAMSYSENRYTTDSDILHLARALPGNQGIESLSVMLWDADTWSVLLRSLWAHPRI
jgi:hypothetical protein